MKKALLLVCILSISVITTACINSFAVQELNGKAMEFMEQGNYQEAIERLKSSIDLDNSVFESHYNLAVAYTKSEDYSNAMKTFKKAITINPDFADSYYSLAVAEGNLATDIESGILYLDENGDLQESKDNQDVFSNKTEDTKDLANTTAAEKLYINDLRVDAIKNYKEYLARGKDIDDEEVVKTQINILEDKLESTLEQQ